MGSQQQIGKNLKKARIKAGYTQAQLAKKAGVSSNYYARLERGEDNASIETVEKLVKALEVKSSEVLPF